MSSWGCLRAEGDPCHVLSHSCILLQPTYSWGESVPLVKLPVCHGLENLSCPSAQANPLSQSPHCAHQAWRTQHTSLGAGRAAKQVARPREKKQINWWCRRACSNILLLPGQGAMVSTPLFHVAAETAPNTGSVSPCSGQEHGEKNGLDCSRRKGLGISDPDTRASISFICGKGDAVL